MGILSSGSWIYSLLLLFSALPPNCLSFPGNEVVGTQCVVPGAAQLELSTEELLSWVLLHSQPQPGLPSHPARLHGWPEFNLQATVPPGPTLATLRSGSLLPREQLCIWILFPQVYSLPSLFSNAHKVIIPSLHTSSLKGRLHFISVAWAVCNTFQIGIISEFQKPAASSFFPSRSWIRMLK